MLQFCHSEGLARHTFYGRSSSRWNLALSWVCCLKQESPYKRHQRGRISQKKDGAHGQAVNGGEGGYGELEPGHAGAEAEQARGRGGHQRVHCHEAGEEHAEAEESLPDSSQIRG